MECKLDIMTFQILSRTEAVRLSYEVLEEPCVVISITDPGSVPARFHHNPQIKSVLRLSFADADENTDDAMTKEDAEKIVSFVKRWKGQVSQIIVHCEAGVSRSAGVSAALMLWLTGSDQAVFDSPRFRPNMRCYRLILNEFQEDGYELTQETMANYCREKLSGYYKAGVPDFARTRLEQELACVGDSPAVEYLLLYHALSQAAERSGHILHTAGEMTGSLLVFLLGQSAVNPLPAHDYCPRCGWYEVSEDVKFGLDLPPKCCPECGAEARQDGFGIASEMVWSARDKEEGPSYQFHCSEGFLPFAMEAIRGFYAQRDRTALPLGADFADDTRKLQHIGAAVLPKGKSLCDFPQFSAYLFDGTPCISGEFWRLMDEGFRRVVISEDAMSTALQKAQAASGIFAADMLPSLPGVTARDIINTALVTEKECAELRGEALTYYDIACRLTFPNNSYMGDDSEFENCFELLKTPEWNAFPIYFRDDVFDELISLGLDSDAASKAATFIRTGQGWRFPEKMEEMGIPQHIRDTAAHCLYLSPRASGAQRLVSLMLLARYMQHDPVTFFRIQADQTTAGAG